MSSDFLLVLADELKRTKEMECTNPRYVADVCPEFGSAEFYGLFPLDFSKDGCRRAEAAAAQGYGG